MPEKLSHKDFPNGCTVRLKENLAYLEGHIVEGNLYKVSHYDGIGIWVIGDNGKSYPIEESYLERASIH